MAMAASQPRVSAHRLLAEAEGSFHAGFYLAAAMASRAAVESALWRLTKDDPATAVDDEPGIAVFIGRLREAGLLTSQQCDRLKRAVKHGSRAAHGKPVSRNEAASILQVARVVVGGELDIDDYSLRIALVNNPPTIRGLLRAKWRRAMLAIA